MTVKKKTPKKLKVSRDPDEGLELNPSFMRKLLRHMKDPNRTYISHEDVKKKYGFH